jgi:hypothetical protein
MDDTSISRHRLSGWLYDPDAPQTMINDTAVRIRAGILLWLPLLMAYTLLHTLQGSAWIVTGHSIVDTFETDAYGRILYQLEAVRRTYDYSLQTGVLCYGLFEMLAGMFAGSARFSPTIQLARRLALRRPQLWKPLAPKRFAWSFGAIMIFLCLVFFNPDSFARAVNTLTASALLPTSYNFLPGWLPIVLVTICVSFMWLEAVLGICAGCLLYQGMVRLGWIAQPCVSCQQWRPGAPAASDESS